MIEIILHADSYRTETEDRVAVWPLGPGWVVALADGMGGRSGGAAAAQAFVDFVQKQLLTLRKPTAPESWYQVLLRADRHVKDVPEAGETTGVALYVDAKWIAGASVGDSGAWLITPEIVWT